jgi:dihydrofolate reductase
MYEVMAVWETMQTIDEPQCVRDFALIWQAADKVVYSTTLEQVSSARTEIRRAFDPEAVRELKRRSALDVTVAGAELAAQAIAAGLVDEVHLFVTPIVVGGGTRALPDELRVELELLDEHRFSGGVVYLRYATLSRPQAASRPR